MFHTVIVFYFGTESNQSTEQSESTNPELIAVNVDDNLLIKAANIPEANLMLKNTEKAIAESTSGK